MSGYPLCVIGPLSARHIASAPLALLLWPIVAYDLRERRFGRRPDRWHWADAVLFRLGFVVVPRA